MDQSRHRPAGDTRPAGHNGGRQTKQILLGLGVSRESRKRDQRRARMFASGMTTQEVATAEGVTKNTMRDWRLCRGIAPNIIKTEVAKCQ